MRNLWKKSDVKKVFVDSLPFHFYQRYSNSTYYSPVPKITDYHSQKKYRKILIFEGVAPLNVKGSSGFFGATFLCQNLTFKLRISKTNERNEHQLVSFENLDKTELKTALKVENRPIFKVSTGCWSFSLEISETPKFGPFWKSTSSRKTQFVTKPFMVQQI